MEEIRFIRDDLAYEREESIKSLVSMLEAKPVPKEVFLAKRFMVSIIRASRKKTDWEIRPVKKQQAVIRPPILIPKPIIETGIPILGFNVPKMHPEQIAQVKIPQELSAEIPRAPAVPQEPLLEEKSAKVFAGQEYGIIFSSNQTLATAYIDIENGKLVYKLLEPKIDQNVLAKTLEMISHKLKKGVAVIHDTDLLMKKVSKACKKFNIPFDMVYFEKVKYYLYRDYIHFGKIDPLLMDENVSSVSCEGINKPVTIIFNNEKLETNIIFNSNDEINRLLSRFAGIAGINVMPSNNILDIFVGNLKINATIGMEEISSRFIITKQKFIQPLTP